MPGLGIGLSIGLGGGAGGGASLAADKSSYLASVSAGALIATIADPFGSGSTFAVVGSAPATLALASGGRIVAGNGAQSADTASTIVIRASKGQRAIEEPLTFTAKASTVTPTPTPTPTPSPAIGTYLLPSNVNGGEAGKGFTCTGLARDPLDGSWWVGNDGRKNGGSTPDGSIVHLSPDFSTVLGEYKAAAFGLGAGYSVQGVCMMNDLIVAVFKKPGTGSSGLDYFITIDRTGAAVRNVVSPSSTADWNGIAYDSLRNALIVSNVGGIAWRDPVTIAAYSPTKSISVSNVDQVFYVASDDTLLTTGGANGSDGTVVKYRASDLVEIARTTATGSKAIEGIVEYDGKWAIANDAWFHNGGAGLDEVRIIAKLL